MGRPKPRKGDTVRLQNKKIFHLLIYSTLFHLIVSCFSPQKRNPYESEYRRQRALCYKKMGHVDAAIAELQKLLQEDPKNENVYSDLNEMLFELERYDELIKGGEI